MIVLLIHLVTMDFFQQVHSGGTGDSKIVGGEFVRDIRQMPWLISIGLAEIGHVCGGSILTPSLVLTACHCLVAEVSKDKTIPSTLADPGDFMFFAGSIFSGQARSKDPKMQSRFAKYFLVHPLCREDNAVQVYDYGVAVMQIAFNYSEVVKPVNILSMNRNEFEMKMQKMIKDSKTVCYVAGWGEVRRGSLSEDDGGLMSKKLKMIRMYIISEEKCKAAYVRKSPRFRRFSFKKHHQICGVSAKGWGSDCQGDSGGPVVCNNFQLALVSYGFECGISVPATYTDLGLFFDWYREGILPVISQRSSSSAPHAWRLRSIRKHVMHNLLMGFCISMKLSFS